MADLKKPLKPEVCDGIDCALSECAQLRVYLEQLSNLGLDVSEMQAKNDFHHDFCSRVKAAFFPERP